MATEVPQSLTAAPRKLMGTLTLAFMVVAMASPIGVVVGTVPLMIGLGNGLGTPGAFLLIGAVLFVFAFGFAAMARALPAAGGFFGFIREGLGTRTGMAAGFVAVSAYTIITVYVVAQLAYFASTFFSQRLGLTIDWAVWALVGLVLVTALMYLGVKESALVTAGLLVIEFVILAVLTVAVLVQQGPGAFPLASFSPTEIFSGAPGYALALAFLSFVGFEVTAVFTNHVRDPGKTIGRATMVGIVILVVVFSGAAWVTIAGVGSGAAVEIAQGPDAGQLIPIVATANVGAWMGVLFTVIIITSLFATLIAVFNTAAQYTQSLARTLSPTGRLARLHPKHRSPANTGFALAVLIGVIVVVCRVANLDPYAQVSGLLGVLGAVAIFMLEIACALAIFVYFRRKGDRRIWTTLLSPVLAGIALVAFLVLVLSNFAGLTGLTYPFVAWMPFIYLIIAAAGWLLGGRQRDPEARAGAEDDVAQNSKEAHNAN